MSWFNLIILLLFVHLWNYIQGIEINEDWFTFPITNQFHSKTQKILTNAMEQLSENGVFYIKNILSNEALTKLQSQTNKLIDENGMNEGDYFANKGNINIFQDMGDARNYHKLHVRNKQLSSSLSGIGRRGLSLELNAFYEYQPLLEFFRNIVTSTKHHPKLCDETIYDCKKWERFGLTHKKQLSSLYLSVLKDGDFGAFHFDEYPFGCIWMLNQADIGGDFVYYFTPPKHLTLRDKKRFGKSKYPDTKMGFDWKTISNIINEDDKSIKMNRIHANNGDVYCFKGNITLHKVDQVKGDTIRVVLVTTFNDDLWVFGMSISDMIIE